MKSITSFALLAAILVLTSNGCASTPSPTATEVPLPPTTTSPTPIPVPQGKTIVVINTDNDGTGSFRHALETAGSDDKIVFDTAVFPADAPATISLTSGLPEITQGSVTIDASDAGVILDGSGITAQDEVHGLSIKSNNNIIQGLQIIGFSDAGIALHSGAQHNLIGGDPKIGRGPLGQGNLVCGNGNFGIGLWGEGTSFNTITGNYIGVKLNGTETWGHPRDGIHSNGANENLITNNVIGGNEVGIYLCCAAEGRNTIGGNFIGTDPTAMIPLSNNSVGILIDRSGYNLIGPENIIASNTGQGIAFWAETPNNTVTQNSIHHNGESGIDMRFAGLIEVAAPRIFEFNLQAGSLEGWTCPNCTVEVFSDDEDEGATYEGQVVADSNGNFVFQKGSTFTNAHITLTTTNVEGNTSTFSAPISGTRFSVSLQEGNDLPKAGIVTGRFGELEDNRIGDLFPLDRHSTPCPPAEEDWSFTHVGKLGLKWARLSLDRLELDQARSMDDYSLFEINPCQDEVITLLAENDISILFTLVYWDKSLHSENYPNYKNEEEVQQFLDYTRLIVRRFKGRIQYYEILNEALVYVEAADYVNLVHQAIPVIHEEDPDAKIVVGGATDLRHDYSREYFFDVIQSDIMPLVDGVAIHPMYGVSPQFDETRQYYYNYPSLIQEIKDAASANGFRGEYFAEEISWRTTVNPNPYEPWEYTPTIAAKYYARGILINLGMDLWAGIGGEMYDTILPVVMVVQNLGTTMAGASPKDFTIKIESEAENIMSYGFSLSNGDRLFALWTNGIAVDDDPGIGATLIFPDLSAEKVVGIDALNGFEQELITETENTGLIIRGFLIKDYPVIIRFSK